MSEYREAYRDELEETEECPHHPGSRMSPERGIPCTLCEDGEETITCETCQDTGEIDQRIGGAPRSGIVPCPDCQ